MSRGDSFNNFLRVHDQAIYDWLGGLTVDYGQPFDTPFPAKSILRIYATPMKAFGTMAHILIRKGWAPPTTVDPFKDIESAIRTVPLPFCSIYRNPPESDPTRDNPAFKFRHAEKDAEGNPVFHKHPSTFKINYQLDFWCLKKYTEAHIYEWVMRQIGESQGTPSNELLIPVSHGGVWGVKKQALKFQSWADNTDLEVDTASQRMFRFTADLTLNAIYYHAPEDPKEPLKTVISEYCEDDVELTKTEQTGNSVNPYYDAASNANVTNFGQRRDFHFHIDYTTAGYWTKRIEPPYLEVGESVVGLIEFSYLNAGDSGVRTLEFLSWDAVNEVEQLLASVELPKNKVLTKFQTTRIFTENLYLRFRSSTLSGLEVRGLEVRSRKYLDAEAVPANSVQQVSNSNVYDIEGLESNRAYLVYADVLDSAESYQIIVANSAVNPTASSTKTFLGSDQPTFSENVSVKFGETSLRISVEPQTATLGNVVALPL